MTLKIDGYQEDEKTGHKIFTKDTTDKGLLSKIYKQFWKVNNKKINTLIKNGPKILTGISQKKIYRWQISIWKDTPHHMSSGKCILKQQSDTPTNLLEGPKSRTLTKPNADENMEQQEHLFNAGRNSK